MQLEDVQSDAQTKQQQYHALDKILAVTYTLPVLIWDVAILQRELDLLLELFRHLIIAIHEVCVALGGLNQILNLFGSDASPVKVNTC